jgi:NAD(P)-dependent dehydrogenase (short-subunit alcohol dehydrogenase family)
VNSLSDGTRVLIAGAGRGIGRAIAFAFARQGARLVIAARTYEQLEETRAGCDALGARAIVEPGDVSRDEDVARIAAHAEEKLGGIDVLVNAAGVQGPIGPTHECEPEAWLRALEVNLYGSFLLCHSVTPGMLARGSGRLILLAGGGATSPRAGFSAYAASKAGVVRLAETLAEELRPYVQVNAIAPGLVDTALLDEVLAAGQRAGAEHERVRGARAGKIASVPAELAAELAVFLSTAPTSLTGKLISAPHDPWRQWVDEDVPGYGLYTLRRLDPHTVKPLLGAFS